MSNGSAFSEGGNNLRFKKISIYILDFLHNTPHIIERDHLLKIGGFWSLIHGRNFTQSQYNLATMHSIIQKS